jgi:molybdate transport system permease protein
MQIDWFPLWLSLRVGALATALSLVAGLWLGWLLAERQFRGKDVLEAFIELPLILPPTVLGYYLLVVLSQASPLGRFFETLTGAPLLFTWRAAVVAATVYTAPLLVRSVRTALEEVDPSFGRAARGLGASPWRVFWYVSLPLARGPVLAATALAFARSMADFGITILIAGNLPNRTQTLSVAVFDAVERGDGATARALVLVMSAVVLALLVVSNRLKARQAAR